MTVAGPWDLGDVIRLTASAVDAAGAAVNCTAIVLTVTLPDGTTATPAVTNPPGQTGAYTVDYVPTLAGRHKVRWVGTTPAFAYTDIFDVLPADPQFVLSLADARAVLRLPAADVTNDAALRLYMAAVTTVVEAKVGPQAVTNRTLTRSGGKSALLLPTSATAVVSVTENGGVLSSNDYTVDIDAGIVYRGNAVQPFPFLPGHDNVVIVYTTGSQIVAANIQLAARKLLRHLWDQDQGGARQRPQLDASGIPQGTTTIAGYAVPYAVAQLLEPTPNLIPGFA